MAKPPAEQTIEQTLKLLEINTDVPPEVAAADAAARMSTDSERELVPAPAPNGRGEEHVADLFEDADEDEDDEDDEPDMPLPPPRAQGMRSHASQTESADMPALIPQPKLARPQARQKSPIAGKLGKSFADKVPGAEKMKVYKRIEGRRHFISDYTKEDLQGFSDMESFIVRYCKKPFGAGEYDLVGVDALNREIEVGQVRLIEELHGNAADGGNMSFVSQMLQQQATNNERWLENMKATMQQPQQKDPIELLKGVMDLKKTLEQDAQGESASVAAAAARGQSETMQMMMMMMNQQQQAADRQNQLMMTLLSKPKEEDPLMKMLMAKLFEEKKENSGGGAMPPPMPPAPEQPNIVELLKGLSEVVANMGGGGGGDDDFKEFLKTLLLQGQQDKLGIKDVLALVQGQQEKPGTDDFRRSIDNLATVMNLTQTLNKVQEPGPGAGLFDALGSLFSNRDFAGAIANTIRAKTDQSGNTQAQIIAAERQRLEMQQRLLQREQAALAQQRLTAGHPAQTGAPTVVPQPVVVQAPQVIAQPTATHGQTPQTPAAQASAPEPSVTVLSPEEKQRMADRVAARNGGQIPPLPALTHEHCERIAQSKDEAELVERTVALLVYFAENEQWQSFSEQLLGLVRGGHKRETVQYLKTFFDALTQIGMITAELNTRILKAAIGNLDTLQAQLTDFPLPGDDEITGDTLMASPG